MTPAAIPTTVAAPQPPCLPDAQPRVRGVAADAPALRRAVRDEMITLVNTRVVTRAFANQALTRLGDAPLPGRFLVGVCLPLSTIVSAPRDAYAGQVATAQMLAALQRLPHTQLRAPQPAGGRVDDPLRQSVAAVHSMRLPAADGRRRFLVIASVRLTVTVAAVDKTLAWPAAQQVLAADVRRLRPFLVVAHPDQLTRCFIRSAGPQPLRPGQD